MRNLPRPVVLGLPGSVWARVTANPRRFLWLVNNEISGSFPTAVSGLPALLYVPVLSVCFLFSAPASVSVAKCWCARFCARGRGLYLSQNRINGSFPSAVSGLPSAT